jgi:hypothetical protein
MLPTKRRRASLDDLPPLEFSNPKDIPEKGPIVTYRRGTKWLTKRKVGALVLVMPAHSQLGIHRVMRIARLEALEREEIPPEEAARLFMFYGPLPRETFTRVTLED